MNLDTLLSIVFIPCESKIQREVQFTDNRKIIQQLENAIVFFSRLKTGRLFFSNNIVTATLSKLLIKCLLSQLISFLSDNEGTM